MNGKEFDNLVLFFDQMARTSWLSKVHEELVHASGDWTEKEILDVGCGTGRLLLKGAEEAKRLTGIDLSSQMVEASKENFILHGYGHKSTFVTGDAYDLPFTNNSFDKCVSTCVMFLLPEPEKGILEMLRVTKNEGKIAMLNPAKDMNPQNAAKYAEKYHLSGFEETALLKWSNVSTSRHRYAIDELTNLLLACHAKRVVHKPVLEGLALITTAEK
ncbi:class I SAM-dependent methyltransferase [Bacillus taeanensis]|nr:class I SAM-dependent methyltransferase [Bacillus taeanensis]